LFPWEIIAICDDLLSHERSTLVRRSPNGSVLDYLDESDAGIDHKESARDFVKSIEDFVYQKAQALAVARQKRGMPKGLTEQELVKWRYSGSQIQSQ
jgi:DNA-directed RNA polymerase III subunit RPC1